MSAPVLADVSVGTELPPLTVHVDRETLVRYAGASGDFNPIHWNPAFADSVGLPGVIAHGMFTMASAIRVVTDRLADPSRLVDYGVRFTRPVVVSDAAGSLDNDGADIEITGKIGAIDAEAGTARIDLTATFDGQTVLGRARATVRLSST